MKLMKLQTSQVEIARRNRRRVPDDSLPHVALVRVFTWRHLRVAHCGRCGCLAAHRDEAEAITWVVAAHNDCREAYRLELERWMADA